MPTHLKGLVAGSTCLLSLAILATDNAVLRALGLLAADQDIGDAGLDAQARSSTGDLLDLAASVATP
jgi:hypothetical protein